MGGENAASAGGGTHTSLRASSHGKGLFQTVHLKEQWQQGGGGIMAKRTVLVTGKSKGLQCKMAWMGGLFY